jgi:hypothetical protein
MLCGDGQKAVDEAEKAITIAKICKCPITMRARLTHILSKTLSMDPGRQKEAETARQEAQRLRRLLPDGRTDLRDESDEAYDSLVVIIYQ